MVRATLTSGRLQLLADVPVTVWQELGLDVGDEAIARIAPADLHVMADSD